MKCLFELQFLAIQQNFTLERPFLKLNLNRFPDRLRAQTDNETFPVLVV